MPSTYSEYVATLANECGYDPLMRTSYKSFRPSSTMRKTVFIAKVTSSRRSFATRGPYRQTAGVFLSPATSGRSTSFAKSTSLPPVSADPSTGTRNPLTPVSTEVMDMLWPTDAAPTTPSVPTMFAMQTQNNVSGQTDDVLVGPAPDAAYPAEVVGTVNPTPLSEANPETYLTKFLWDLFFAASMVRMSAFMRNFGAQSDDPTRAMSWEATYKTLFQSADLVDARQRFAATSWTSAQPENYASNQRG